MKKLCIILSLLLAHVAYGSNYCTIFAHGIIDGPEQMHRFDSCIKTDTKMAVSFPDAQLPETKDFNGLISYFCNKAGKKVNRLAMFMGQSEDIHAIHHKVAQIPPDCSAVLYGCSRGAAALVTYMALHNPAHVSALVLDACPTSMPEAIHAKLAALGSSTQHAESIFATLFPAYRQEPVLTPFDAVAKIENKELPILLIHSKTDKVVPYQHSLRLYQKLLDLGFTNVHLALMPDGRHSYLLQDPMVAPLYQQAVHTFYQKYGLPHQATWTEKPYEMSTLQKEEIDQICKEYDQSLENTLKKSQQTLLAYAALVTAAAACLLILHYKIH